MRQTTLYLDLASGTLNEQPRPRWPLAKGCSPPTPASADCPYSGREGWRASSPQSFAAVAAQTDRRAAGPPIRALQGIPAKVHGTSDVD